MIKGWGRSALSRGRARGGLVSVHGRGLLIAFGVVTSGLSAHAAQAAAPERIVAVQPGDTVLDCAAGDTLRWSGHLSGAAASGLTDAFLEADGRVVAHDVPDPADGGFVLDWIVAPGSHLLRLGVTRHGGSRLYLRRLSVNVLTAPPLSWDGFDRVSAADLTVSATPAAGSAFRPVRVGVSFNGASLALLPGDGFRAVLPLSNLPPGAYPLRLEAFDASGARYGCPAETVIVPPPATGQPDPAFRAFDDTLAAYMARHHIHGGSLAVVKDGRLVYARGYGWADADKQEPVQTASLFRIASLTKPLTALAVMTLVQEGRLDLDAKAFPLLGLAPLVPPGGRVDPRLWTITVRQLLHHTGGWDRDMTFDPMDRARQIAEETGTPAPAGPGTIIRYMMGRPLDFDPGTRYAYSNFGYCVLGRVIEKVSGQPYDAYVKAHVLAPVGITDMRIGGTRLEDRAPGEVRYYDAENRTGPSVFPAAGLMPFPYGVDYIEAMDSHGGWIASATDLARISACLDTPSGPPLLRPPFLAMLAEQPGPSVVLKPEKDGSPSAHWYGLGWMVASQGGGHLNLWHNGNLSGTTALLVHRYDGICWVVLFNGGKDKDLDEIDPALHRAADSVTAWPAHDLFTARH